MSVSVSRADLQRLSDAKVADASLLLSNERWSNAYYLAGYAVELALKACAARQIAAESIPDRRFVTSLYTHVYDQLIGLAGLRAALKQQLDSDTTFAAYWGVAAEWTPDARYEVTDSLSAQLLLQALVEPQHGVLTWIKTYW